MRSKKRYVVNVRHYFDDVVTKFIYQKIHEYEETDIRKARAMIAWDVQRQFKLLINVYDLRVIGRLIRLEIGKKTKTQLLKRQCYLSQLAAIVRYYARQCGIILEGGVKLVKGKLSQVVLAFRMPLGHSRGYPKGPFERFANKLLDGYEIRIYRKPNLVTITGDIDYKYSPKYIRPIYDAVMQLEGVH